MYAHITEVSYEQASDLIGSSTVLERLDLGAMDAVKILHHTHGIMMVVTSAADGKACAASI